MELPRSNRRRAAVLGALLAVYATSPGQTFVLSGFTDVLGAAPDSAKAGLGLSAQQLSGSYLVGTLMSAACLTRAGQVADRIGPRRMIALAGLGLALAGVLFSNVLGLVTLTGAFFLLRFTGQGVLSLASSHALALRFDARLGSVEGLRGATLSLAVATAPLIAVAMITQAGWRQAAWMLPLGAGALAVFAAYGLLDPDPAPEQDGQDEASGASVPAPKGHTLAEARRTSAFWTLVGCATFHAALITSIHFHLQGILRPRGMDEVAAAATFVPYAAAGATFTLVGGLLVDRFAAGPVLGFSMLLVGSGGLGLGLILEPWAAHLGMALLGAGSGLGVTVYAPTLARFFGRAHHGAIRGASGMLAVAGSAIGPFVLSGVAAASAQDFGPALLLTSAVAFPFAWAAFRLHRP